MGDKFLPVLQAIGVLTVVGLLGKLAYLLWERIMRKPKKPESYGKWAVITGSTSGIGVDYTEHLAKKGMDILVISRSESKLKEQTDSLKALYKDQNIKYIVHDFTATGAVRDAFYEKFRKECEVMHNSGGIGILINNVGIANQYPQLDAELTDKEAADMITCNIDSTLFMSRTVLPFMSKRDKGAILNLSSGSGNIPGAYIAIYSATKAFITQYSRSLHLEYRKTGIDVLVVTPFYFVSNKYRKEKGSLLAPMPDVILKGSLAQLGKKGVWQAHAYWFHCIIGKWQEINPLAPENGAKRMEAHRESFRRKKEKKEKEAKKA
jgi:17beta-estradiol 17-dehydrogenase / very-long-chain 3-oxoacyl-CoA reductase